MSSITSITPRRALVIGATGGVGGEVAAALLNRGWSVRGLSRSPEKSAAHNRAIDWMAGDAMQEADVVNAAQGAQVIFHGANPPGYQNWAGLAPPMLANAIEAAKASGARLLFPGNVYNYGPDAFPLLREDSPQHPVTRKGKIRVEMERTLEAATRNGVRALILRAGDFFGPQQPASMLKNLMLTPGKPITSIVYPGLPAAGHAWAYLPDLAETFALLADREAELPAFDRFHFGGHWLEPGTEMVEAIRRVAGVPNAALKPLPVMLKMLTPFVTVLREMREMQYLWRTPIQLDNGKLLRLLGTEPHTPLDEAVRVTLTAYGCLPAAMAKAA